jgi:hypothetical protein
MNSIYYSAAWTDSGCLISYWHGHATIREATGCINCAGGYVVGVEDGVMRALTVDEAAEFQRAIHAHPGKPVVDAIEAAEEQYGNGGTTYAVMVRIKMVDHYTWTTWMTYGTYSAAAAHAGAADRIVVLDSPQWVVLKKHTKPILTDTKPQEFKCSARSINRPSRREGETLVEYVNRFLESYGVSEQTLIKDDEYSYVTRKPLRVQVPDFVEFVLNWLNEWGTKELERMYTLEVPEWLETLRKRVRQALKRDVPSGR